MRTSRVGTSPWALYFFFFALTAIGAMVIAGAARAAVCVEGKRLNFDGFEKLKVTASGFSETERDPLIAKVKFKTKGDKIKWKYRDEEDNVYNGKIVRAGSDRKFDVFLNGTSKDRWENTIKEWVAEIVGQSATGQLKSYTITGKCNRDLTEAKVTIQATFEGRAGGENGIGKYFGKMTAALE